MITAQDLVAYGLDPKSLRARFDKDESELSVVEKKLVRRWRDRAQSGRDHDLLHYRIYLAIDRAWDADFYQSSNALIAMLRDMRTAKNEAEMISVAREWNMTHLLTVEGDDKGQPKRTTLSMPALYSVIISLPRNYTAMRVSRIVNERMSTPLFKYEPAFQSETNRLRCEVATQYIDQKARYFGYSATLDQAVQASAKYGHQLMFPCEEWYSRTDYDGGPRVGVEGLRYHLPHPSRSYYDLDYPLWTLNSGTGCRYAGFWQIVPYGTMRSDKSLWNRERIKRSYRSMDPAWQLYFQTTGQCRLSHWPTFTTGNFVSQLDREAQHERPYYTQAEDDHPVWKTEHFEMFNPAEDLDDPSLPDTNLWLRVVMASDDVPLYVACLPDRPVTAWLYEPDDSRAIQQGMMLQVMPFGDQASNLMTQILLSSRQNLANATLYDKDVLNDETMREVQNPNETLLRKINFIGYSGRDLERMMKGKDELFTSYAFPKHNLQELMKCIDYLLGVLERVVGMSAQEVGSYASHEQTAEEMRAIHTATSQRYERIASWADRAIEAWKSQLYTYSMTYGSGEALAYISPELIDTAVKVGFRIEEQGPEGVLIKAPVGALRVEAFAAQRDGPNRVPWPTLGQNMVQLVTQVLASPALAQAMGPGGPMELIGLLNQAFEAIGLPRAFRIKPPQTATPDIQSYVQSQLSEFANQAKGHVQEQLQNMLVQLAGQAPAPQLPPPG